MSGINKGNYRRMTHPAFRLTPLAAALLFFLPTTQGWAEEYFNPHALEIDNPMDNPVDLSQFTSQGGQLPGTYHVDIFLNNEQKDSGDITFIKGDKGSLQPMLTPMQLETWGVILASSASLDSQPSDQAITGELGDYIPQASTRFNFSRQRLDISVPQAVTKSSAQGSVDPQYWDQGVPAMLLDYSFTGGNNWVDKGGNGSNYFLSLRSGANLGGWRLRNYSTWNYSAYSNNTINGDNSENRTSQSDWDSINTFVQHDIPLIKGQFTAGDSYTPSDIFDSVQFRGAQVASDDNMLPDSLRGFAPTVRGIASSNAQVTVKQNGSVIYQTYVSPGAFTINDLYPTSSGGDLQVTIKESDGSIRTFTQPFSSVPVMQREGRLKYAFMVGEYRAPTDYNEEPVLGQGTLMYGLSNHFSIYGGAQVSEHYKAAALGVGVSLGELGSISTDITQAYTAGADRFKDRGDKEGQSVRFQYSKSIEATDSTVTLAGYRYSTKGFYTFGEAMDYRSLDSDTDSSSYYSIRNNKRSKLQVDLTQDLSAIGGGSLSLSGYQQDYWDKEGYERNLSLSYSQSWNGVNWTVMYTWSGYAGSDAEDNRMLALNVSVPLSRWLPGAYVSASTNNDMHGRSTSQMTLSGTALEDNNLSYNVSQGYGNRDQGYSGMVSSTYKGTYGQLNAGYNYNDESKQINYGVQGSVVVHPHGVTLGQSLAGDMTSLALVRAPGAGDAKVMSGSGVRTDWRGYAIVPYLSPYKRSRVALEPSSLAENVDLKQNVASVVPTAGAVVVADFKTNVGSRVLMTLLMQGGQAVPFGAMVSLDDEERDSTGIVGEGGQVYLSGVPDSGKLTAKWGDQNKQQCRAGFTLPKNNTAVGGVLQMNVTCGR